jgi:iron(III) transport system permease protein
LEESDGAVVAAPALAASTARGAARELSTDRLVQWAVAVATAVLVMLPLLPILYQSVLDAPLYEPTRAFTLGNYTRILGSGEFWSTLATTLLFAAMTTLGAVVIGTGLAVLVTRTDLPGRDLVGGLVSLPFYVSPLVLAFAWSILYGPSGFATIAARAYLGLPEWQLYSIHGIALVSAVYYAPYAYLYATASLALSDPTLEDAARIAGAGPVKVLWTVTLPLLRPALLYSTLLTLVSSVELLSIPLVLGSPVGVEVLATYLYKLGIIGSRSDYGGVAAVAVIMLLLITVLVWLQVRLTGQERRFVTVGGKATRGRTLRLGGLRWPLAALVGLYALFGTLLPLGGIVLQSLVAFLTPLMNPLDLLTLDNYAVIFAPGGYGASVWNSLLIAVFGAGVAVLFIALAALVVYRSDFPGRRVLTYLALYPRAVPGLIVGVGFLWAFLLIPGVGGLRNTLVALTIAFVMRFIPIGFGAIGPSILRISTELDRAARVSGATWTGAVRGVVLPLLRPALLSGYVLLAISFLKEYASAIFLFARGSEVIGTTMIELWRQGTTGPVAALSTIQLAITFAILLVANKLLGARIHG